MPRPFVVALLGLVFAVAVLACGDFARAKGAFPLAFLVGGTMIVGGLVVELMRSLAGKRSRS